MTDSLKTKTAELSFEQFLSLTDMNPVEKDEWIQEHIGENVVAVESVEATFVREETPEACVTYYVEY